MGENADFSGAIARCSKTRGVQYRSWRGQNLSSASFTGDLCTINALAGGGKGK